MEATYVDHMGTDLSVVDAAKVSFGKKSEWEVSYDGNMNKVKILSKGDQGLINFLARGCTSGDWESFISEGVDCFNEPSMVLLMNHIRRMPPHWTPFAHTAITLHLKMPIFVARQIMKTSTGMVYNEISRRYVDGDPEFYMPETWRKRAENVKQGSSTETLPHPEFIEGFCINCGDKVMQANRKQGGGRVKKYCSIGCKSKFTNLHRDPYKQVFTNAKARVNREGKRLWKLNPDKMLYPKFCPYLGLEIDYSLGKGKIQDNSPSFDRIDSSGDYTPDNVEVVSKLANSMKNSASVDEQVKMAKAVLLRHRGYVVDESRTYEGLCKQACETYQALIEDDYPAEQARMVLPQSMYTEVIATGNLYSWANMFIQRTDSHAQKETQDLAKQIGSVVQPLFPVSWEALVA